MLRLPHSPHLPEDPKETERRVLAPVESSTLSSRAVDLAEAVETDTERRLLLKRLYRFLFILSKSRFSNFIFSEKQATRLQYTLIDMPVELVLVIVFNTVTRDYPPRFPHLFRPGRLRKDSVRLFMIIHKWAKFGAMQDSLIICQ